MTKNNYRRLRKNVPYALLRLDLKCNAKCLFCNVPPESYKFKGMTTLQAKAEISRLASIDQGLRLDITGGEPTLRNDLEELISYASKKGAEIIRVQSNGILLANKKYVESLKEAGLNGAFIALHSSDSKIHDYLVGKKGAFNKCITGIKNLLELNIEVFLNPVVMTSNYENLPRYINFVNKHFPQIKFISLSVVQPRQRAWGNKHLVPRYKIISPYIRKVLSLAKKYNLKMHNPYCGVPLCIGGWDKYLEQCVEYCVNCIRLRSGEDVDQQFLGKVKGHCCSNCDLNVFCNGVWKEYALLYSFSDLKPIHLD